MPTLAPPQQFFGYGRKPYADYFPPAARPSYGVPSNPDPYGQAGNEELQLAAQKKVLETLGTLDEIEAAKQERAQRMKYLPQTRELQDRQMQDKLGQGFAQVGGYDRAQQAERDATSIDWSTPAGRAAASELAKRSPEHADAVAKAFSLQSRIEGPQLYGGEQETVRKHILSLPPPDREVVTQAMTKDGLTFEEAKAKADWLKQHNEIDARLAGIGVPEQERRKIRNPDGSFDLAKAAEAEYKARITPRPLTPAQKETEIARTRSGLSVSINNLQRAKADNDEEAAAAHQMLIDQGIEHLKSLGIDLQPKPKPIPVGEPTDKEKVDAFKAKFGMEPKDKAHWSMAYDLAKQNKLAQGASAPAGEVQQMYVPSTAAAPPPIPASHISALIAHPEAAKDFDAKYGAGAAAKVLGKK